MIRLVQMSGVPGAGKSTVARRIAALLPRAVVIDHDVIKSAQLDGGVEFREAGPISYEIVFALAKDFLEQGCDVIIDSPCIYTRIVDRGTTIAEATNASYSVVECVNEDIEDISMRLNRGADRRPSQRIGLDVGPDEVEVDGGAELFREWMRLAQRPRGIHIAVDTHAADFRVGCDNEIERILAHIEREEI